MCPYESSLQQQYDIVESHIRGLEALGKSKDTCQLLRYQGDYRPLLKGTLQGATLQIRGVLLCFGIEKEIIIFKSDSESCDDYIAVKPV